MHEKYLLRHYGIGVDEYNALLAAQGGLCAICKKPEILQAKTGELLKLAVDHNHLTGEVRSLLCGKCNKGIGLFSEDPDLLHTAAIYLERFIRKLRVS